METRSITSSQNPDQIVTLHSNFPMETLSVGELERRDKLVCVMSSNSKTGVRYSREKITAIFKSIVLDDLTNSEVADIHGCSVKFAWNIRRGKVQKDLLRKLQEQYVRGDFEVAVAQPEESLSQRPDADSDFHSA